MWRLATIAGGQTLPRGRNSSERSLSGHASLEANDSDPGSSCDAVPFYDLQWGSPLASYGRRKVATRQSAKKFYVIDKIVPLNTSDGEQLQLILANARAAYHCCMVRSNSDVAPSSSIPIVGCRQIELRRYTREQTHLVITMEWMDGFSLADIAAAVPSDTHLPTSFVQAVACACVRGLAVLHKRNQVHRCLRPSNILFGKRGAIKLADMSWHSSSSSILTKTCCVAAASCRTKLGAEAYFSPERIDSFVCTEKSDIWATGIIILELVLRRFPYALADPDDGVDYLDLLDSIASNEVPIPSRAELPHVSEACMSFIQACLVKDPELRPTAAALSSHEFVRELSSSAVGALVEFLKQVPDSAGGAMPSGFRAPSSD